MSTTKVTIPLEKNLLSQIDETVSKQVYPNRSKAIQEAAREKLARINRSRLAVQCAKLDPEFEPALADEGVSAEIVDQIVERLDERISPLYS
jgi:Arc/MetJ-type ribon-helix-helix transcriptional regulator